MSAMTTTSPAPLTDCTPVERCRQTLLHGPFGAKVRGRCAGGPRFESDSPVRDISATSFSLHIGHTLRCGDRLFVITRIERVKVALLGTVVHSEQQPDGLRGLAVAIKHFRFLQG